MTGVLGPHVRQLVMVANIVGIEIATTRNQLMVGKNAHRTDQVIDNRKPAILNIAQVALYILFYYFIIFMYTRHNISLNNPFYDCKVNCEWSSWTIGKCSKTCGGGQQINTRSKTVEEDYGGKCTGKPSVSETCNSQDCPGKGIVMIYNILYS